MNYQDILQALRRIQKFAFSRYGDGEIMALAGPGFRRRGPFNTDGHYYYVDLGARLRETVAKPKDSITYAVRCPLRLKRVLRRHSKIPNKRWADANVLHRRSWSLGIEDLFEALRGRNTKLVGPGYLVTLRDVFQRGGVIIPKTNCWKQHAQTVKEVRQKHEPHTVWVLCMGMSAGVLIYDLVDELQDATFLDAGSVFDPYAGVSTRTYHKKVMRRLQR